MACNYKKTFPKPQYSQAVNEFITHWPTSTSFSYDIFDCVYFRTKVLKWYILPLYILRNSLTTKFKAIFCKTYKNILNKSFPQVNRSTLTNLSTLASEGLMSKLPLFAALDWLILYRCFTLFQVNLLMSKEIFKPIKQMISQ